MRCQWIRGVAAVAIAVLALALATPASAAPLGPVTRNKDQGSLITQFVEWIGNLWSAATQPGEQTPGLDALRLQCSGPAGDRGCAIDPNG